ncbi:Uncharacterised protein [uncultured Comamonas sp.]|nr:Uncharacterised protein [uncultured Comamonas sp.]
MTQQHPLDAMLHLQPQADGSFVAHTHAGYANMVGPYGGATAALLLHSVLQHPDCLGEPLSLTVNFAGPVGDGAMHIVPRAVRTNRTTQHWVVELRQTDAQTGVQVVATTASVVTAVRRETFSAEAIDAPTVPPAADCPRFDVRRAMTWLQRYDWRIVSGGLPTVWDDSPHPTQSRLWIRDEPARPLDFASLAALCDVFFPRIWLRRARIVPVGTVSLTIYFHADRAQLAAQGSAHVLAQADAQALRNGFFDQTAQVWDTQGHLLATSHQIVYYKE